MFGHSKVSKLNDTGRINKQVSPFDVPAKEKKNTSSDLPNAN